MLFATSMCRKHGRQLLISSTCNTPAHKSFLYVYYIIRYCDDKCFKRCWGDHNRLHKEQAMATLEQQQQKRQQVNDDDEDEEDDDDDNDNEEVDKDDDSIVDDDEVKPKTAVIEVDGNAIPDVTHDDDVDNDEAKYKAATMKIDGNAISCVRHDDDDDDEDEDDVEAKPTAAAMKVDTDLDAVKTADVDISSPAASGASSGVRITGVMGPNGAAVNGVYEATREMSGDMPVYVKMGDNEMCMEYNDRSKSWEVKTDVNKGTDSCWAFCDVPFKCLPEQCPAGQWQVWAGTLLIPLPTVTALLISQEEVEAYREELEREAAREVKGNYSLRITGAKGANVGLVNGLFQPTEELCCNATVYAKVGNNDICMEYNAPRKQWRVKGTEDKGTDLRWAFCDVPAKCLPQDCPVGKWCVYDGSNFVPQRAVTVSLLSGDVASAVVGAGDVDDDETKPKAAAMKVDDNVIPDVTHDDGISSQEAKPTAAAAMKVDTDPAAVKTAGVDIASPAASGGIRITGAMGPSGCRVNGVYEATSEMSRDMPVYVKVGSNGMCMEYNDRCKSWQVKLADNKGTDLCWAFCDVPTKCLPEQCPAGQWRVNYNCKHSPQPAVTVLLISQDEVEAYREELEREAAREVKGRHNVRITGATGVTGGLVNGVYKPTNEMSGNVTVYQKIVGGNAWLEYNAASKSWHVRETKDKGIDYFSWARCPITIKGLPQECAAGQWYVYDGSNWVKQPAIKIRCHS